MSEKNKRNDRMSESEWIRMGSEEAITAVGGAARWGERLAQKLWALWSGRPRAL